MYQLEGVSKRYSIKGREILALDGLDFRAAKGEFVAVVGASGSGKSTLLMLLGGLARPSAGRVLADGADLYAMDIRRRAAFRASRIGFVFQTFLLIPYLNALDNVLVPVLAGSGKPADSLRRRAEELLGKFGVADRMAHRPPELSVGERQRVAMARALLLSPDVLLADEPTGNLDPNTTAQLMEHIAAFHKEGGTVILVTHNPDLTRSATRTVRLAAGRLAG
jgi:putative ABC transport system ATP-binding protein